MARFPVKTQVPLDTFIIIVLILLLIIATVIKAINTLFTEYKDLQQRLVQPLIPKILSSRKYEILERAGILCLLERSQLFSIGIFVSCYYKDADDFELLIGTGTILNIQGDGKIQALIDRPASGYQDILDKLANNDSQI